MDFQSGTVLETTGTSGTTGTTGTSVRFISPLDIIQEYSLWLYSTFPENLKSEIGVIGVTGVIGTGVIGVTGVIGTGVIGVTGVIGTGVIGV